MGLKETIKSVQVVMDIGRDRCRNWHTRWFILLVTTACFGTIWYGMSISVEMAKAVGLWMAALPALLGGLYQFWRNRQETEGK